MGSALGNSLARPAHGTRWLDIRDFGALTGSANSAATRVAIQKAIDSCNPVLPGNGGHAKFVVFVPTGDWYVDRPLMVDFPNIELVGEGPGSFLGTSGTLESVVYFGIPRTYSGTALTAGNFVDLFGKLDATVAPATGVKYGYALGTHTHLAFPASPFSHGRMPFGSGAGDYYKLINQLVVEWAMDVQGGPLPYGPLLGLADSNNNAMPWMAYVDQTGHVVFQFATVDGSQYGLNRVALFAIPAGTGTIHFCVQVDLIGGTITAYAGHPGARVQVAVNLAGIGAGWGPGLSFQPNPYAAFLVGALGPANSSSVPWVTPLAGAPYNRTFLGLRVSTALRYASNGVGTPQARIDASAINDLNTYFSLDAAGMAILPMVDTQTDVIASRRVSWYQVGGSGYSVGSGLWLDDYHSSNFISIIGNGVRNLTIQAGGAYGYAVGLGFVLDFAFEDASAEGGTYGLADWTFGANYVVKLGGRSKLGARDIAFFTDFATVKQSGTLDIDTWDRCAIRAVAGTDMDLDHLYVYTPGVSAEYVVHVSNYLKVAHLAFDFEGSGVGFMPTLKAGVYLEPAPYTPFGVFLQVGSVDIGNMPTQAPMVLIGAGGGSVNPGSVEIGPISCYTDTLMAIIQTSDGLIGGAIRATADTPTPWVVNTGPGGLSGVVVDHHQFNGLPRRSAWAKHSHRVVNDRPADGQYSEFRCVTAGQYGTATPPGWCGIAPLDIGGGALASHVQGHAFWTGGNTTPHAGSYSDFAVVAILNRYFGGAALAPPVTVYAALSLQVEGARRDGTFVEPSGNGYARVATSWSASAGGASSNAQSVSFPTATGPWGTATAIVLLDAPTGGNVVAQIPINPLTPLVGSAAVFAAGLLRVGAASVPGAGSPAPGLYDAINNLWLRGTPLAPPTTLYFALSTARASTAAPSEPTGGGYARVPSGAWSTAYAGQTGGISGGWTANASAASFPVPTGAWGTVQSIYLMDGATGGNVVASGNLTIPRAPGAGAPAPTVAAGAFWVSWS